MTAGIVAHLAKAVLQHVYIQARIALARAHFGQEGGPGDGGIGHQPYQRRAVGHAGDGQPVDHLEALYRLAGDFIEGAGGLAGKIAVILQVALHHQHVVAGRAYLQRCHLGTGVGKTGQVILAGNRFGALQSLQCGVVRKAGDLQTVGLLKALQGSAGFGVVGGIAAAAEEAQLSESLLQAHHLLRGHVYKVFGVHRL